MIPREVPLIFVFGSNLAGRHGKGAALEAIKNWGAIYGQGRGLQGNSYGIPTKDATLKTLPLHVISNYIIEFLDFARVHNEMVFKMTNIGCGLAGYLPRDIGPYFHQCPHNVILTEEFINVLKEKE